MASDGQEAGQTASLQHIKALRKQPQLQQLLAQPVVEGIIAGGLQAHSKQSAELLKMLPGSPELQHRLLAAAAATLRSSPDAVPLAQYLAMLQAVKSASPAAGQQVLAEALAGVLLARGVAKHMATA